MYWHEESEAEVQQMVSENKNWNDVMQKYKQPEWCEYPQALNGKLGCWSLTSLDIRQKISKEFCQNCECCNIN